MTGSAQLEISPEEDGISPEPAGAAAQTLGAAAELRSQAAERLKAHREKRRQAAQAAPPPVENAPARRRAAGSAAAEKVAERYARTPSFRAALADEARKAMEQAAAEAEVALIKAEAVAAAQQELLAELIRYDMRVSFTPETAVVVTSEPVAEAPKAEVKAAGLTVKLYETAGPLAPVSPVMRNKTLADLCPDEAQALDEEIEFRKAPVFEDYSALLAAAIAAANEPVAPLPANLLEFPRQLKAEKKARPRREEGPLLDEARPQLRIFEVGPEFAASTPEPLPAGPEWGSIWLDAHTVTEPVADPEMPVPAILPSLLPPQVAPLSLRAMAVATDGLLVAGAFVAFAAVAAKCAGGFAGSAVGPLAGVAAATLAAFWMMYQLLFFSLNGQTPGMRYARIGLCTFSDENPSRAAMRKRILAQLVALCPLGLGVLWVLLDEERLGWHDRISRMYQRAY